MSTNNTTVANGSLNIRTSEKDGQKYNYFIAREVWMKVADGAFTRAMEMSKEKNVASGGAVSSLLHAYGLKEDKMEASGIRPFPEEGAVFTKACADKWLEAMAFVKPRTAGTRKTAREITMDAILATLSVPGITWDTIKGVYPAFTLEEVEEYRDAASDEEEPSEAEAGAGV